MITFIAVSRTDIERLDQTVYRPVKVLSLEGDREALAQAIEDYALATVNLVPLPYIGLKQWWIMDPMAFVEEFNRFHKEILEQSENWPDLDKAIVYTHADWYIHLEKT